MIVYILIMQYIIDIVVSGMRLRFPETTTLLILKAGTRPCLPAPAHTVRRVRRRGTA